MRLRLEARIRNRSRNRSGMDEFISGATAVFAFVLPALVIAIAVWRFFETSRAAAKKSAPKASLTRKAKKQVVP